MGSVDRAADNRTFKANFTADGVTMLRERVNEKLKEFMGDYTDDTLVEYVIVLLRNGRGKEQAQNELNVFLGDDSDSFVSWLWDHLALNIDLYVHPKELQDEAPKRKLISEVQAVGDGFQHLNSQSEKVKASKLSRSRRSKDWKELMGREAAAPALHSFEVHNTHLEEKTRSTVNSGLKSPSPPASAQRKRGRTDEQQKTKRDSVSQVTIDAPRRLLQFAVRDAVATSRPSNSSMPVEPSLKRLRSVVSTSYVDSSLVERPQRIQTVSRVANPMATVMKAVAEAAEDVVKFKSSRSVFDRLGYDMNPSDVNIQIEDNYQHKEQSQSLYLQRADYGGQDAANMTMLEHETGFPSDSTSDNEGFDDVNVMGHRMTRASQFGSSVGNRDDSLMVDYSVAKNTDDSMLLKQNRDQEQPDTAPNTSKIVNMSVNVNAWKPAGPPQYHELREVVDLDGRKNLGSETGASRSGLQLVKENAKAIKISNGNKGSQKAQLSTSGSSAAGRPLEDADSRTIFASNVHFAATKDGLSRHFNKFGDVLKVVIVTDPTTGQPKGAAYVEFMRKEAADNALSSDGTSFMSRILKVVRKSAAHQESAPAAPWPRVVRGSPFPSAARYSRVPFPRGITGAFRSRPPIKFGARSLQWKRDAQGTSSDNGAALNNSGIISAPAARGLTYVRTESKLEG
ncbi:nucleolin 2 isoform X2 [Gastrolobium bilobum]|uniref:nucleolin 2 isoform X2 n=1 Tax=Gastrolobium bilobum TaxID=150636 RepID=UPI002AB302F4|nr:nucleolin 2 isoform X2 [Gastrolobium bilobum]